LGCLLSGLAWAQPVRVSGRFERDTLKVGEPVVFTLTASYPATELLLFPDSAFAFAPFELVRKQTYPTHLQNGRLHDSVEYVLRTFAMDSTQSLALPVFQVIPGDCVQHTAARDAVALSFVVRSLPDSLAPAQLPVKITADYLPIKKRLNYPLWGLVGFGALVLAGAATLFFGRPLWRWLEERKWQRRHRLFVQQFGEAQQKHLAAASPVGVESALRVWKQYVEQLTGKPYTTLTTREVLGLGDEELREPLMQLDRMIYSGRAVAESQPFEQLRTYAERTYHQKLEDVRHG
jgi:hypothetical protein